MKEKLKGMVMDFLQRYPTVSFVVFAAALLAGHRGLMF